MATGRIGVTPTLGVRWSKAPTGGTTALSGLDDNSVSLVYSVGYEQVYRNGVLLSRGNDYTATDGTTVTLIDATITGDIIEIFAQQLVPLADAISKGQFTAKGTLLSATAASTPGVLGVGADGTVLTADSVEATGLKWVTPTASALTLITTATAANTAVSLSVNDCFSATYEDYFILCDIKAASDSSASFKLRVSATDASTLYYSNGIDMASTGTTVTGKAQANDTSFDLGDWGTTAGAKALIVTNPFIAIDTGILMTGAGGWQGTKSNQRQQWGIHHASTSYTGFTIIGQSNLTGTVRVYGYAK